MKQYGFIEPEIVKEDYVLGGKKLPEEIIRPNGQWDTFLPVKEIQRKQIETMNCTVFGTLNPLETLHRALYGVEHNWAERYVGIIANTTPRGNSPQIVAEAIRKSGCIPETELPFDNTITTWLKYYSPKPMTQNYLDIGKKWLQNYDFLHEYVFIDTAPNYAYKQNLLMKALKYSPLGVSVMAWQYRNGYYYKNPTQRDNHWCCLYGYSKDRYWMIFDSYDNTHKRLEWNYNFHYVKRYYLKREESTPKKKLMIKLERAFGTKKVFAIVGSKRYWINDWRNLEDFIEIFGYPTLTEAQKAVEIVEVDHLNSFVYGGVIGDPSIFDFIFGRK